MDTVTQLPVNSAGTLAVRTEMFRKALDEAARWYAGGLPPDRPWTA